MLWPLFVMIRCTKIQKILGGRITAAIDFLRFLYEGQKRPKHVAQTVITKYTGVLPEGLFILFIFHNGMQQPKTN